MKKIITNLWFDKEAEQVAEFYASVFTDTKIGRVTRFSKVGFEIHGQPEGLAMTVEMEIMGEGFLFLNGGPDFKINPSVSFLLACESKEEVESLWSKLSAGGKALMELGSYPFSEKYGWIEDKFGVSWQVMYMGERPIKQKIIPTLMFVGEQYGKAEEAMKAYVGIFNDAKIGEVMRYGKGEEPDREGTIKHAGFTLEGQEFAAMDSAYEHKFAFSEGVSFVVRCETQEEIDAYWHELIKGGPVEAQQCGWLKDRFGVSWQIVPAILEEMMSDPDRSKVDRVTEAFLAMKKFDIEELKRAYDKA